jgi:hypothetical protein
MGLYKFCTNFTIVSSGKASRIMLSLDASASMCTDLLQCPGAMMNDPTNKRIDAANQFVDNVAANCPSCQIGVVRYVGSNTASGAVTAKQSPLPVNNAANINTIHSIINGSRCGHEVQPNIQDVAGLAKRNITFGGTALDTAVHMIDRNYDSLAAQQMDRHIIIMTDGDWQTPIPNDIYTEYKTNFPSRPFPIVHGVFLSDSARHVAAGYPAQGLGDCSAGKVYIDLSFLQAATQLSTRNSSPYNKAGMYFGGTTPQTIAGAFTTLFQQIIDTTTYGLTSVTFTNNTVSPPDSRTATIVQNTGANNQFTVKVPTFSLQNGTNVFLISYQIKDNTGALTQHYDTLTIIRGSTPGTGVYPPFLTSCTTDTLPISITCRPPTIPLPLFDSVFAKVVRPQDSAVFMPNDVVVRAFTPFPDNDPNTVALYHLDNNLTNTAPGGVAGAGTPTYSTEGAFGGSISGNSFTTTITSSIGLVSDFTLECWIKPGTSAGTIASSSGITFSLTADGYLSASVGTAQLSTNHVIDRNVWQHVAVARYGSMANIYINGLPMANAAISASGISGSITVGPLSGSLIDEFRLSNVIRTQQVFFGKIVLQIPLADQVSWKINNAVSTGQTGTLPGSNWQISPKGQVQFQFSCTAAGPVIINFLDTASSSSIMWSKNGDPVNFTTNGLPVTATLRDNNHEGHLDVIDINWTDNATIVTPLPSVNQLVGTLVLVTIDGRTDTLHAASMVLDANGKTIHIYLQENYSGQKGNYETGWQSAKIVLTTVNMTVDGKPMIVTNIVDGATPVPTGACYSPGSNSDSLYITFSEPLAPVGKDASVKQENMLRYQQDTISYQPLVSFNPTLVKVTADGRMLFVFSYSAPGNHVIAPGVNYVGEQFSTLPYSPKVAIDYCTMPSIGPVIKIGPNPFVPGSTDIPSINVVTPNGQTINTKGVIIMVQLKRPTVVNNKQSVFASFTIFDAVGNVIQDKAQLLPVSGNPNALAWGWNGKNKRGMMVAGGTYLTRIRVWSIDSQTNKILSDETISPPKLIGVKTKK